ncbi:MAG: NAD-dependent protein deacylase [Acutalibacteraceae bacterium]
MDKIEALQKIYDESNHIVFFGGAGVSTESGIPDFRSVDGLYNQKYKYPPEQILSHTFFTYKTEDFYDFYKDKMLALDALPNKAHIALAKMEEKGKLLAVVTQNIDGLHQKAGSKTVYELHGSVHRNHCMKCNKSFDALYIKNSVGVPLCDKCKGIIKPDVVLYEETLPEKDTASALLAIKSCDTLIIAGTSLSVYPAAGFINYFNGNHIVLINKDKTDKDSVADLVIHSKVGEVLSKIKI